MDTSSDYGTPTAQLVTVVVPVIPPRMESGMAERAMESAEEQSLPVRVSYRVDTQGLGAAAMRQSLLEGVETPWVAFLDDDDELLGHHCEAQLEHALRTGADYVYSNFRVPEHPMFVLGEQDETGRWVDGSFAYEGWRPGLQTTITTLVRTELAQRVGFKMPNPTDLIGRQYSGEDYDFTIRCHQLGARIEHLDEVTWLWHHHGKNTSGMPSRWKDV